VLLVDTQSEEELYEILKGLPLWEQTEAEITPMQGFKERLSPDETA
jgi:muconolactone delta-isomerase